MTEALSAQDIPHAIIGGWAVVAWGYLRTSDDLDVLVDLPASKRTQLLAALSDKWHTEWIQGGQDDPIPGLLRALPKDGGIPVDLIAARGPSDREAISRALSISIEGISIPIVAPEDLIAMKLEAGGGQDYEDARRLLSILSDKIDSAHLEQCCRDRHASDRLIMIRPISGP